MFPYRNKEDRKYLDAARSTLTATVPPFDTVAKPAHYADSEIECIDAMLAAFGEEATQNYARVNAFKYVWRAHEKGKEKEDIRKAICYLKYSIGEDPRA